MIDRNIHRIIEELSLQRDVDLFSFHLPYIESRIEMRMDHLNISSYEQYFEYIQSNDNESFLFYYNYLYGNLDLVIHRIIVSYQEPLMEILQKKGYIEPFSDVRVWIPNSCEKITGTLVGILLEDAKNNNKIRDYTIFLTHPSKSTIEKLRHEPIPEEILTHLQPDWIQKYLECKNDGYYRIIPKIRQRIILANHDFLVDNPLKSLSIVILNQYISLFSSYRQTIILRQIYDSLSEKGILLPCEAKENIEFFELFESAIPNSHWNLYTKKSGLVPMHKHQIYTPTKLVSLNQISNQNKVQNLFFQVEDIAYILVSENGTILEVSNNLMKASWFQEGSLVEGLNILKSFGGDLDEKIQELFRRATRTKTPIKEILYTTHPYFQGKYNTISIYPLTARESKNSIYVFYFWEASSGTEKENQEKLERAIREIHHRVKNQMTILSGILQLETQNPHISQESLEWIQKMSRRLKAIEIVQNRMSESPFSLSVDLKSILNDFILELNQELLHTGIMVPMEFSYNSEKIHIHSRLATSLMLSVFEISQNLIQNIMKRPTPHCRLGILCNQQQTGILLKFEFKDLSSQDLPWILPDKTSKIILNANNQQMNSKLSFHESHDTYEVQLWIPWNF